MVAFHAYDHLSLSSFLNLPIIQGRKGLSIVVPFYRGSVQGKGKPLISIRTRSSLCSVWPYPTGALRVGLQKGCECVCAHVCVCVCVSLCVSHLGVMDIYEEHS